MPYRVYIPVASPARSNVVRFGLYEFDAVTGELRKQGMRIRLEGQPLAILRMLLEHPAEVVGREELQKKLWPADTFVDFEHSLNAAVKRLRTALNDSPDEPRYIETLARRGYRFIAPLDSQVAEKSASERRVPPISTPATAPARFPSARVGLIVLVLAIVAGATVWGSLRWRHRPETSTGRPVIHSLAVLPLENLSGDPSQEYFADGMTDELITDLAQIGSLRVISRTSVMHYKGARKPLPEIARELGVDGIVEGTVVSSGDRVRITSQLVYAPADQHLWAQHYERNLSDVLALQSEIAQAIASEVRATVAPEQRARLASPRTVDPEVYDNYLKGRYAFDKGYNRSSVDESIAYLEEAIRKDPTFAPAYVALASAYERVASVMVGAAPQEHRANAIRTARKALELDPDNADAHVVLAIMLMKEWRWSEAQNEYRRALQLNPSHSHAHAGFADWLICQGQPEEALKWARRGRELDPLGSSDHSLGWILFQARRYDEAIHEYRSAVALRPDDANWLWKLGFALIAKDRPGEAIPVLEKALSMSERSPGVIGLLVRAYAHAGRRTEAIRLLEELKRRQQKGYVPAAAFVNAYLGLGDNDQAFVWLDEAYKERSEILMWLKMHPYFDPLRNDPRFGDLVHRVGL